MDSRGKWDGGRVGAGGTGKEEKTGSASERPPRLRGDGAGGAPCAAEGCGEDAPPQSGPLPLAAPRSLRCPHGAVGPGCADRKSVV